MDDLIEIIIELIFEGSIELMENKKVPKWLRSIVALFFVLILIGIIVLGIIILDESILAGSIIIGSGLFFIVGIIIKIRKYTKNSK